MLCCLHSQRDIVDDKEDDDSLVVVVKKRVYSNVSVLAVWLRG